MSEEREDELVTAEDAIEEAQEELEGKEDEIVEESAEDVEPEGDEVEQRAKKYGHLSKEEWERRGNDPNQWKSPEEFDKTGKILDQLYSMRKKLDQRDREIQALVDYQQRTSQREYERAKQDLTQRLAAAKDDMDVEAVSHYTKELTRVEELESQQNIESMRQAQQAALQQFQERNAHWFNDQNPDLMARAAQIDKEIKTVYPQATFEELAQKIELRMQYEYPDRVGGRAKPRASIPASQSSVNKTVSTQAPSFRKLPQELKDTYFATKRIIESQGGREYSQKDFMDQLKRDGEI